MSTSSRLFAGAPFAAIGRNPHPFGRDFIVSDLHGRFAELVKELGSSGFNPARDRLFSAGDLCDRGPQSLECLGLLRQPWFKAVLGNHDCMLLTRRRNRPSRVHTMRDVYDPDNGTGWLGRLTAQQERELDSLIPLVEACPLVMRVAHASGDFNVTHAQLTRQKTSAFIRDEHFRDDVLLEEAEPYLTWSRSLWKEGRSRPKPHTVFLSEDEVIDVTDAPFEAGIPLTYVGHSIQKRNLLHRSHLHFDRGAATLRPGERVLVLEHGDVVRRLRAAGLAPMVKLG